MGERKEMHTVFWWVNLQKIHILEDLGVQWQYLMLMQTCSTKDVDRPEVAEGREDSPASVTPTANFQSYTKRGNLSD